ncbi:dual OB domain-containing protein [Vibrio sp. TRT 21S02]|uniref:dual OB domain-containing protein n=1 Tax=Vibrio sp. TRT 21S02 TaxID=3418507 RepID=UPI003CEB2764
MKELIITDLTRFKKGNPNVCIAATDPDTGEFFRPMPYITSETCKKLNLQPGSKLCGAFTRIKGAAKPHVEDSSFENGKSVGRCTKEEFKRVLDLTLSPSVPIGFDVTFAERYQKHIELKDAPDNSIITIKIRPKSLTIHEDKFNPGKIKASFWDDEGNYFGFLSITDRRFHDFAQKHYKDGELDKVMEFIELQEELYLRIGLSRSFQTDDGRNGYWLQVNGIYTFPNYFDEIEDYD